MPAPDHPLVRAAIEEVIDLHGFFEGWLGGTVPDTGAEFARLEAALAESFTMVSPDGRRFRRHEVTEWLRDAHGARSQAGAFRITVLELEALYVRPPVAAIGYVEEQCSPGAVTRRRSTALFEARPDDPNRVRWLALHETWTSSGP